jgi:ParB-like chromosome segregation protein Spo0J
MSAAPKLIEKRNPAELKPHPRQAANFREPLQHEVEELADDLKRNGQLCSVEVLPDGTLVAGHKRVAAARLLGWQEVTCWVRLDLAEKGADAAERRLIEDNLTRRHLAPLELARCYRRLKQLGRRADLCQGDKAELRDQIGKKLNMSGRNLDRYLRVLECTPQEIQDAVSSGALAVTVAEKVAGLSKAKREQLAEEIRAGADPAGAVRKHVSPPRTNHKKPKDALGAFLRWLERGVPDLEGRVDKVWIDLRAEQLALLGRAEAVIGAIRQRGLATAEANSQAEADLAVEL